MVSDNSKNQSLSSEDYLYNDHQQNPAIVTSTSTLVMTRRNQNTPTPYDVLQTAGDLALV